MEQSRAMFTAAKDALASRAAIVWVNQRIARYGRVQDLKIDSRHRTVEISCLLDGELTPIAIKIGNYVVETERRFYLANEVKVSVGNTSGPTCIEVELTDAWVWDMYRPARFVPSVKVLTFRDVNVERLPERDT